MNDRYQEATEKYESVMRTEPNVAFYTNKAKERICFCLVKVCSFTKCIQLFYICPSNHHLVNIKSLVLVSSLTGYVFLTLLFWLLQMKSAEEAVDICSEAHQREPRNIHILRDRAEGYILLQEYEKGSLTLTDYYKTFSFGHVSSSVPLFSCGRLSGGTGVWSGQPGDSWRSRPSTEAPQAVSQERLLQDPGGRQVRQWLETKILFYDNNAENMVKGGFWGSCSSNIERRLFDWNDCFFSLVFRSANKQEIIKAYRKLAQQWHPDNFQSEADKKEAEKKFIDIASAKEVLTDPGRNMSDESKNYIKHENKWFSVM